MLGLTRSLGCGLMWGQMHLELISARRNGILLQHEMICPCELTGLHCAQSKTIVLKQPAAEQATNEWQHGQDLIAYTKIEVVDKKR